LIKFMIIPIDFIRQFHFANFLSHHSSTFSLYTFHQKKSRQKKTSPVEKPLRFKRNVAGSE
ncbi:hypothetical protein MMI99_08570, partial [Enterococcus cecorum]|nr:hypothetical protein [Enterococcus cecorum]